jgi:glycosyltransferase involved in cell wall biosynthesis
MKLLLCCEFYYPSVGGVQEVMKQIAERLVVMGHDVTIATTALPNRDFSILNGVKIAQFAVSGNLVRGMQGEIERYREFVRTFDCDAILIKAAQQWTFDALWPILSNISARKVFIPCGFSGLYEIRYKAYFKYLAHILRQFDSLIFYSDDYRDINFAREHQISNCVILSNGASEIEFETPVDPTFRQRHGIPEESFLILTVGSLTGAKGHLELAQAVELMPENGHDITLLLNGNDPFPKAPVVAGSQGAGASPSLAIPVTVGLEALGQKLKSVLRKVSSGLRFIANNVFHPLRIARKIYRTIRPVPSTIQGPPQTPPMRVQAVVDQINSAPTHKRAMILDLPREELIQAYFAADLFVFASHVEYSPLVLFESAAAGTPFLSSRAGNAQEITKWLGGGFIFEDESDLEGYKIINPQALADEISVLANQKPLLEKTGERLRESWRKHYTWSQIARRYEGVLSGE